MGLVEGLDDAIADEYERIRGELRVAITESDYTQAQVAALAGIGESTLRQILNAGSHAAQIDTLLRIAFVVGVRIEIAGTGERPFQIRPLATGSRRSSALSAAGTARGRQTKRDKVPDRAVASTRKSRDQQGKGARRKPTNTR